MHKKQRSVQKNDHINFGNGTLQWRKMTNMRYAKFFKLRKIKFIYKFKNIYSIEYRDKNSPPRNIIVTVRKIKKMNVFDALTSFNYQNDISMEKVP